MRDQLGGCNLGKRLPHLSTNNVEEGRERLRHTEELELIGFGIWLVYMEKRN